MRPEHLFSANIHDSAQPYVPVSIPSRIYHPHQVFTQFVEDITEHQTIVLVGFPTGGGHFASEIKVSPLDLRASLMRWLHDRCLGDMRVSQGPCGQVGFERGGHSLTS